MKGESEISAFIFGNLSVTARRYLCWPPGGLHYAVPQLNASSLVVELAGGGRAIAGARCAVERIGGVAGSYYVNWRRTEISQHVADGDGLRRHSHTMSTSSDSGIQDRAE